MLKNVTLKDFVLDSKVFNISVQGGKVTDIAEADQVLKIANVAVIADGVEKWLGAEGFFDVVSIELSEHIFKQVAKATIPTLVISLESVTLNNVLSIRPGEELNIKGKANVGLPEGNVVEPVVAVVELKEKFFEVLAMEFAGTEVEAKLAKRMFKTAQKDYTPPEITDEVAKATGEKIGINWDEVPWDVDQFKRGMLVELEHGLVDPETNVTNDDLEMTAKIAWAHLKELSDYYDRLAKIEKPA